MVHHAGHVLHAVDGVGVAEHDFVLALGQPGRYLEREIALEALAAVRTQENFHRHIVAGARLGSRQPGVFDAGNAALGQQVDGDRDALDAGRVDGVHIQAVELVAPPSGQHHGRGHGHFAGGLHGGKRQVRAAREFHVGGQAVGGLFLKLVQLGERVEQCEHHQVRRPLLLYEDVEAEILLAAHRIILAERAHLYGHWNHGRFLTQHAHDAAVAVLMQRAHDLGGIGEFVGLELGGQRHDDLALAHGHVHRTEVEE